MNGKTTQNANRNAQRTTHNAQRTTHNAQRTLSHQRTIALKIDVRARRVWRDEQELHLTQLEYEALEYLTRRAGQVVTHQELWHEVWKHTSSLGECEQRTVRQAVKRIRSKLGEDWRAPRFLYCLHSVGYRCVEGQVTRIE